MRAEIEIIGAVDPECVIEPSIVRELLAAPEVPLDHDGAFTGRPSTHVRTSATHVLKERAATDWAADAPAGLREAIEDVLNRERLYRIHAPAKTWFIAYTDDGVRVGNVTPRMLPLHRPEAESDPAAFFRHLRSMLQTYIRVAATFHARLDEGLSNFAEAADGTLYYVDDDIYPWDDFAHFSQSIGVTIRKVRTLSPKFAQVLGQLVRQAVVAGFGDAQGCDGIADAVRGLYFGGPLQEQRRDGFIEGLLGVSPHNRSRRATQEQRPIALLADIHANLPALEAVLAQLAEQGIEQGIVLGDIVGYGPHPQACIERLREWGFEFIRGNHDHAAATGERPPGFSETAFKVIEWTRTQLDEATLAWLGELPRRLERNDWIAQHGAPMDPSFFNAYVYRLTYEDNLDYLATQGIRWAFHGHTHTPGIFYDTGESRGLDEQVRQSLSDYQQALVCPGSVGQPRRGGTNAQWAVFNPATTQIEFFTVPYDIEATIRDMEAHRLPAVLIDRLRAGT